MVLFVQNHQIEFNKGEKMLKLLKNLKQSYKYVLIVVVLLIVQAWSDLTLPDFTSKIVNNGIQSVELKMPYLK